jgi:hypothetical protein
VGEVAHHADGLAGVLVVVVAEAVVFQHADDVEEQAAGHAVIRGHGQFPWWRAGG